MKSMIKAAAAVVAILAAPIASATLTVEYQFNGRGNWSIDGAGSTGQNYTLRAMVPTGSTVEKAFLFQTQYDTTLDNVVFGGTTLSGSDWASLGSAAGLGAWRADVTTQVATAVGAGDDVNPFLFSVTETNSRQDGTALVVVYSNPAEAERTIALLDGNSNPAGDSTSINLADPITADQLSDPDFQVSLSLGIGYGFQPSNQYSTVDVNGTRMTSSAGGQDDGAGADGALITVGDTFEDDFLTNPSDPLASSGQAVRYDDEAYNLVPFLSAGDSQISLVTTNPSNNDNIFFAGLNITARAGVNAPPPPPPSNDVPAPAPVALLLAGLALLLGRRRVC